MNRIALKMLIGDRAKYVGLIFGIMFATLLMSQQMSIFVGILSRTASQIRDIPEAAIWVMDPRVQFVDEVEPLPDTAVGRVRGVPGVEWAVPLYKGQAIARAADGLLQQVILMGLDDATLTGAPRKMLLGDLKNLREPDALIMDSAGFRHIWPDEELSLGKVIELNERRAKIVGICESAPPFMTAPVVFTRYSLAAQYVPQKRNQLSFVLVRPEQGANEDALCSAIEAQTGLVALRSQQFIWKTLSYYLRRTGIPINFGITILLGFIVGAAITGQTFFLFIVDNMRQFGALKAIGVSNGRILMMVLLQAAVVGLIGYGIGIGLAALFFETTNAKVPNLRGIRLLWQVMMIAFGAMTVIITLVSVISIRRVLVTDPAEVFRG
ncbi:MAG: ABC transporter permease [Phycisphaerae bacterium]